jgi:dipeptidyl aminopeptidase/acylaminoacyl peptidase
VIEWKTADGQALRGALLLPPTYRAGQRLPLVVWVYGGSMGSNSANTFGLVSSTVFNMQVLATRGYAVLFPDAPVRVGSPMADLLRTVLPGVDAAIEQGYADAERIALMGQSYGSYSVLALITQTNRFKAAVITAAVLHPDLAAGYLGNTGYYEKGQGNMGASIWENRSRYIDNSPLYLFDRIQTPLLIGQGERDGDLVPSEAIFAALQRLEKPVEFRLYQGEGHVITRRPNVMDFWQRRLDFLASHLNVAVDSAGAVVFDGDRVRSAGR